MTKRILSMLLACLLLCTCFAGLTLDGFAASQGIYAPYAMIEYGYTSSVKCGTIRYVSQVSSDSYFYSSYWPSGTFGYYTGPSVECGTASISMSLSYIGINKTANDILSANNGATVFGTGWGGSTYKSYSASALATATDAYINGNGKYSPPVIHIPGYSTAGHYVVVIGRSGSTYQILDPWQRAVTSMTVNGSSATYSKYGYTTYDTIDQIHQWYNANAVLDSSTSGGTSSGTTGDEVSEYASTLEFTNAHCQIECVVVKTVNSEPCSTGSNGSVEIESYAVGDVYTATGLFKNSFGNYWYRVTSKSGKTGYVYAENFKLVKGLTSDIKLVDSGYPMGHVAGSAYYLTGSVDSPYNELTDVTLTVYNGFGTNGTVAFSASGTPSGKSYPLASSTIDAITKFGTLATGKYTYVLTASYRNCYATGAQTLESNTGTLTLLSEYFMVVPTAANPNTCSHSFDFTPYGNASCTTGGRGLKACTKCGLIEEGDLPATGHTYGAWQTTVTATCTSNGTRVRSCTGCGVTQTENIKALGHKYTLTSSTTGSCTVTGSRTYTCSNCKHSYTETDTAATGHDYDDGVIITEATCTSTGVRLFTCRVCGSSYKKSIYATGHNYVAKVTAPTCSKPGYTTYTCTGCGDSYKDNETPANDNHSYKSIVTKPTCTAGGYTTYTCTACGHSYKDKATAATGHKYTSVVTQPTCTDKGYTTYTCSSCKHSYQDNIKSASGHSYKSVVTKPTCTKSGYTTHTCSSCKHSYTDAIVSATGHTYKSVVTKPTCTTAGYTTLTCVTCGNSTTGSTVTALGHNFVNGKCSTCGAADPSYSTVTKPTLTLRYPSLSFEDQIQYNVYFTIDNTEDVVAMGLITFDTKLTDGTIADAVDVVSGYVSNGSTYMVHTNGIPGKNLGDAVYFKVCAKLTDGSYVYSDVAGYNAVAYAKTVLSSSTSTMKAKALMVAMLNYGAASQEFFGYKTDNLMNSFLSAAGKALVADYNESMVDPVVQADSKRGGHFVMDKTAFTNIYPTVSFEGAFSINYYLVNGLTPDSGITFCYWDAKTYASAEKLTTANATGILKMVQDGDRWYASVDGIAAKDMDKTIYIAAIYKSGGTAHTTSVIAYSLGKYCETIAAKGDAFGAATAVYGYYAKAYFAA